MKKGQKYFDKDFGCVVTYLCGPQDPEYEKYLKIEQKIDRKLKNKLDEQLKDLTHGRSSGQE